MKRLSTYIFSLLIGILFGCESPLERNKPDNNQLGTYSILTLSLNSVASRAVDNVVDTRMNIDGNTVRWTENDHIEVHEIYDNAGMRKWGEQYSGSIINETISEDGKTAQFKVYGMDINPTLTYKILTNFVRYGNVDDYIIGYVGLEQKQYGNNNTTHISSGLQLYSNIIEVKEDGSLSDFSFEHAKAVLKLNVKLGKGIGEEPYLSSIVLNNKNKQLASELKVFAGDSVKAYFDDEYAENTKYSSNPKVVIMGSDNKLSAERVYTAYMEVLWNDETQNEDSPITITLNTADGKWCDVEKKAIAFQAGIMYNVDITIESFSENKDKEALMDIFKAMNGYNWLNCENWGTDVPISEWEGVTTYGEFNPYCDEQLKNRVKSLTIEGNSEKPTKGELPSSIGQLTELVDLYIYNVDFNESTIPSDLYTLNKLETIYMPGVNWGGKLSVLIENMTQLKRFALNGNNLTGYLPAGLFKLKNIEQIDLESNLFYGNLPQNIGECTSLNSLRLASNFFDGVIPDNIGNILGNFDKPWSAFTLCYNRLSGSIPQSLKDNQQWSRFAWLVIPQKEGYALNKDYSGIQLVPTNITNVYGEPLNTGEFFSKNKYTVVFYWATWCNYSKELLPTISLINDCLADKGVDILAFNRYDDPDDPAEILNYIEQNNMTWSNCIERLFDETDKNSIPYMDSFGVPAVHVVDGSGNVLFSSVLSDDRGSLILFLEQILGEKIEYYASTDYSQDGITLRIQSAKNGKTPNRLIVMGDAFVDRDMGDNGKYMQRMREAMEHFFSIEPTKSYRDCFDVDVVNVVSENSVIGNRTKTALGCSFGQGTRIDVQSSAVFDYARRVSDASISNTVILVVINDSRYAGTCWTFSDGAAIALCPYVSNSSSEFAQIVHHEAIGHGFGKLLDEYIYNDGWIDMYTKNDFLNSRYSFNMGYNLTIDKQDIPWSHFIDHPQYPMVGVYEGGYFYSRGVWRAEENQCMNDNVPYFNGPSRELIVKRIFSTAGEIYSWDKFVKSDKYEPISKLYYNTKNSKKKPLAPPVFVDKASSLF